MSDTSPPEGTSEQDSANQGTSQVTSPANSIRADAINALVASIEQLLKNSGNPARPILLFSGKRGDETPLEQFLACLRKTVCISKARVVAILLCLIVLAVASIFVPQSLFANLITKGPDKFELPLPKPPNEIRPSYVLCCPSSNSSNLQSNCCALNGDKEHAKTVEETREKTQLQYANLDLLIAQQAYKKAQNDGNPSPNTGAIPKSTWGRQLADAFSKIPTSYWIMLLFITCVLGFFTFVSSAAEETCLSIMGGYATAARRESSVKERIVSPSFMRAVIRSGALLALIRDLIERDYPRNGVNRRHLRAVANDLYDACDGEVSLLYSPPTSTKSVGLQSVGMEAWPFHWEKLDWLRDVASRTFLRELANEPALEYLLEDQAGRRRPWLRIVPIIARRYAPHQSETDGESDWSKDAGKIVALILALILLPLLGGYFGADSSNKSLEDQTRSLSVRLAQISPSGAPGLAGAPGIAGPSGPQGATGASGVTGQTGSQGATGTTGSTGQQGSLCGTADHCCGPNPCGGDAGTPGGEVLARFSPKTLFDFVEIRYPNLPDKGVIYGLVLVSTGGWPPDPIRLMAYRCNTASPASPASPEATKAAATTPATEAAATIKEGQTKLKDTCPNAAYVGDVSAIEKKSLSAVLNAEVWIEERHVKHTYEFGFGKNLLVIHILPRNVK
jgi:hypothetical protein